MGGFARFMGRTMFIAYFVFMAFTLMKSPEAQKKDADSLSTQYPKFYNWVMTDLGFFDMCGKHIPRGFIEPEVVTKHAA